MKVNNPPSIKSNKLRSPGTPKNEFWIKLSVGLRDSLHELTGAELKVWLAYKLHANTNEIAWLAREVLMQETGLHRDSVSMARTGLVEKGWLISLGFMRRDNGELTGIKQYKVVFPDEGKSTSSESKTDDDKSPSSEAIAKQRPMKEKNSNRCGSFSATDEDKSPAVGRHGGRSNEVEGRKPSAFHPLHPTNHHPWPVRQSGTAEWPSVSKMEHKKLVTILWGRGVGVIVPLTKDEDIIEWQTFLRRDGAVMVANVLCYWLDCEKDYLSQDPTRRSLAMFVHQYEQARGSMLACGWTWAKVSQEVTASSESTTEVNQ